MIHINYPYKIELVWEKTKFRDKIQILKESIKSIKNFSNFPLKNYHMNWWKNSYKVYRLMILYNKLIVV